MVALGDGTIVEVVLNHAKTMLDKVQVYDSRIQRYLSQAT